MFAKTGPVCYHLCIGNQDSGDSNSVQKKISYVDLKSFTHPIHASGLSP